MPYIGLSCLQINDYRRSPAERNNALSAEARRILSILADSPLDTTNTTDIIETIATDENGRPFFQNSNMDFSISHSGAAVAVSLVQGENIHGVKIKTGCDIQLIRHRKNLRNITEENFSAAERDYIFSQDETLFERLRFFQIWTLKECYIKLRGLSVFDMPKVPSFISCDVISSPCDAISFYLYELTFAGERYMLATAIENGNGICPEIRMFSQQEGNLGSPGFELYPVKNF